MRKNTAHNSRELDRYWRSFYRPQAPANIWEWAEERLIFSKRFTNYPGPYRIALTPYAKGPLEAFHTHSRIILCFGTQTAKTTIIFLMISYIIDQDPGPALFALPTDALAKRISKKRLQVIINDSPELAKHKTGRDDDFQLQSYTLDRMSLNLVGSNSPAGVSSDPIKYFFGDEIDQFATETTREADALTLAMERTKAYWNSVTVLTSTPTVSQGNIWHQFNMSDRRHYHVPCLRCGTYQKLEFDNLRWPDLKSVRIRDLDTLGWYECARCNGRIEDRDKPEMLAEGRWIAEAPDEKWAGFHLNSLYSPWPKMTFGAIAAEYLRSRPYPEKYRGFTNLWLALPWDPEEEGADTVDDDTVAQSRSTYRKNTVPVESAVLVLGSDVQENVLYFVVKAFARIGGVITGWIITWGMVEDFRGLLDVSQLAYPCTQSAETYRIRLAGIDSRYRTAEVYDFCRRNPLFVPLKGMREVKSETGSIPWKVQSVDKHMKAGALRYFSVNTMYWKELLYAQINQGEKNDLPKTWHTPDDIDPEFLRQIASEREVKKRNKRGQWERHFVLKKGYAANHYLDCVVYADCVADILGVRYLKEHDRNADSETPSTSNGPVVGVARSDWMQR